MPVPYSNLPPLPFNDTHVFVRVERPIREHTELTTKAGIPQHAMTVRGDVRREMQQLAKLMEMESVLV